MLPTNTLNQGVWEWRRHQQRERTARKIYKRTEGSQAKSFSKWQQLRQITRENRMIFQFSIHPLSWNMVEASFCKKVKPVAISVHWLTWPWNTIFPISQDFSACVHTKLLQSCPNLCNSMGYSLPGTSVHGAPPGKNTGVGCYALLQGIFPTQGSNPHL